jgi:hypothetical protein
VAVQPYSRRRQRVWVGIVADLSFLRRPNFAYATRIPKTF